ncbi:unnamed protein product [Lactuca virosa]|uniref:Uncharacterized protein n=1 Tax=Lactuca virosa TaxID=75947 RepID=A0AAU9MS00_9ASTR|nr:unnamed protein product [Lactuca virosa]
MLRRILAAKRMTSKYFPRSLQCHPPLLILPTIILSHLPPSPTSARVHHLTIIFVYHGHRYDSLLLPASNSKDRLHHLNFLWNSISVFIHVTCVLRRSEEHQQGEHETKSPLSYPFSDLDEDEPNWNMKGVESRKLAPHLAYSKVEAIRRG